MKNGLRKYIKYIKIGQYNDIQFEINRDIENHIEQSLIIYPPYKSLKVYYITTPFFQINITFPI